MQGDEARVLLGFPPNSRPTRAQVKEAYRKKVWESHPDLFPAHEKPHAESKFKLISEAYSSLISGLLRDNAFMELLGDVIVSSITLADPITWRIGARGVDPVSDVYTRVVRTGVPVTQGGRKNQALVKLPFLFLILGTVSLGASIGARAYKKQKEAYPSHNPFLP